MVRTSSCFPWASAHGYDHDFYCIVVIAAGGSPRSLLAIPQPFLAAIQRPRAGLSYHRISIVQTSL